MKLTDMKLPKLSKKELKAEMAVPGSDRGDRYPYGLELRFDKEEIEKVPALKKLNAGDTVNIQGVGKVTEVRITDVDKGKARHNIEIQVQKIGIANKSSYSESFKEAAEK